MKTCHKTVPGQLLVLMAALFALNLFAAGSPREHLPLDANWKFHLGDDWPNALYLNKAGVNKGPAAANFNDTAWRTVNLPAFKNAIKKAYFLADSDQAAIPLANTNGTRVVQTPHYAPDVMATVLVVEINGDEV